MYVLIISNRFDCINLLIKYRGTQKFLTKRMRYTILWNWQVLHSKHIMSIIQILDIAPFAINNTDVNLHLLARILLWRYPVLHLQLIFNRSNKVDLVVFGTRQYMYVHTYVLFEMN